MKKETSVMGGVLFKPKVLVFGVAAALYPQNQKAEKFNTEHTLSSNQCLGTYRVQISPANLRDLAKEDVF